MTDDATAMDQLDRQVRKFAGEALEREGIVTGWVLLTATSSLDDDGQPGYAWNYSVGPDTDLLRAVGLVEAGRLAMHHDLHRGTP